MRMRHGPALLLLSLVPAHANDQPWPSSLRLSAGAGKYDHIQKPLPCPHGSLFALVTVYNPEPTPNWTGGVIFNFGAKPEVAQFTLAMPYKDRSALYATRNLRNNGKQVSFSFARERFKPGQTMRVSLNWSAAQVISITVDGKLMHTINLQNRITDMVIMASGATVSFEQVIVECGLTS